MKIYVDADACPVVPIVERVAKKMNIAVTLVCDTAHVMNTEYSQVVIVDKGADSADFRLISLADKGDIMVTQDYGVAAMALGKGVFPIHQNGKWYTNENIDQMLIDRHMAKTARRKSKKHHIKGPAKRTLENDIQFEESFSRLLAHARECNERIQ